MPLPNPWVVIGVVLSMAACFVAGHVQGHKAERKTWELALARQQAEAAQLLAQSETARRNAARAFNTFKDKVEVEHAAQETRIDAAHAAYRRLLAERGGLHDAKGHAGGACGADKLPGSSAAAAVAPTAAAGCRLSSATSEALLDLARDADRAAAYACHRWAVGIAPTAD
jgi:hypothetical protein